MGRGAETTGDLTVYYKVRSSSYSEHGDNSLPNLAVFGSDFTALSGSVVIPDGYSSVSFTVTPINDGTDEDPEPIILDLIHEDTYNIGWYDSATVVIADNDDTGLHTVTITATDSSADEDGQETGTFTVSRGAETSGELVVYYSEAGSTATSGDDYTALTGLVSILNGNTSATITITPVDDAVSESSETVVLTIAASDTYNVGSPSSDTVTIADDDSSLELSTHPSNGNNPHMGEVLAEVDESVVSAAIAGWADAGATAADLALLGQVEFVITDLGGSQLAYTDGTTVYLDADAVGYGWFVDSTPYDDAEFISNPARGMMAPGWSAAFKQVDLLTVLRHEMGHVLGASHSDVDSDLMDDMLGLGTRIDVFEDLSEDIL